MPPQLSDDDRSEGSQDEAPEPNNTKNKAKDREEEEKLMVESDDTGEEDDDEPGEDEYVVEAITNHLVDEETGELRFEVKWEGYEKKSEQTWEPEENLETAQKILNEYMSSMGGKEALLRAWADKKAEAAAVKGKKRSRVSTGTPRTGENGGLAKRGRKSNGAARASDTPPASSEFKPPTGNWEDEVVGIDACEGTGGSVVVFLTWKGGQKSQHPLPQVYKRCPQKMLKFYESHLVFKKNDETS